MSINGIINKKLFAIILFFIALSICVFAFSKIFAKTKEMQNQQLIESAFESLNSADFEVAEKIIESLTHFKHLSEKQKCTLYHTLAVNYFQSNEMKKFQDISPYAIFYSRICGETEKAVYIYSLLAQYYLEIGADKAGFEMILAGRRLKNFYTIKNPVIRSQALHAYGRFLVYENDFESALKAQSQMEEDASIIEDSVISVQNLRRALAFKAYILMNQGKTDNAFELASDTLKKYFKADEKLDHIAIYDFLLPILWVKTQFLIRANDFEGAIEANKNYGKYAKKFDFTMKKALLCKELMFALPVSMIKERELLFTELALDADILAQDFIEKYTFSAGERLLNVTENLRYTAERQKSKKRFVESALIVFVAFMILLLFLAAIYSETQIDGLTKLRNRRALNNRVEKLATAGKKYSAVMIDIDNFKKLNDNFGHDFGDEVLRTVAEILLKNDKGGVKCYRYGGEEMVIILEHFSLEKTVRFAENIRGEIAALKWQKDVHVTASFGIGFEGADVLKEADENMYQAKQNGKNFTAYKKDGKQFFAERRLDIRNPLPEKN